MPFPPNTAVIDTYWLSDDVAYVSASNTAPGSVTNHYLLWRDQGVVQDETSHKWGSSDKFFISPDGHRLLHPYSKDIELIDLRTRGRRTIVQIKHKPHQEIAYHPDLPDESEPFARCWWQSNDEVGYIHPVSGKRVIVRVRVR